MKTRTLRTGIAISEIGLGCWAIGGPFWDRGGWMGYGDCDDAESVRCLRRAAELGVTFFDTADVDCCGPRNCVEPLPPASDSSGRGGVGKTQLLT